MFFGCHDKIVGLVFVIHNVFQGHPELLVQVVEEVLFVYERYTADFLHHSFGRRPIVDKVRRDGDGQFAPEFFSFESCNN